jgi:hypothetical protein
VSLIKPACLQGIEGPEPAAAGTHVAPVDSQDAAARSRGCNNAVHGGAVPHLVVWSVLIVAIHGAEAGNQVGNQVWVPVQGGTRQAGSRCK